MAVVIVHQGPTLTQEKYDEIVRRFTEGRGRMESPSDWPVEGLLVHAAGQGRTRFSRRRRLGFRGGGQAVRRCPNADLAGDRGRRAA